MITYYGVISKSWWLTINISHISSILLIYDSSKIFCPIVLFNTLRKLIEKVISKKLQIYLIVFNFVFIIWLIFTAEWILIELGSCSLTALVDITSSMKYGPMYQFTSFFASFLNIKFFILNIILSSFFYSSTSFCSLSAYLFTLF